MLKARWAAQGDRTCPGPELQLQRFFLLDCSFDEITVAFSVEIHPMRKFAIRLRVAFVECLSREFYELFGLHLAPRDDLPRLHSRYFGLKVLCRLGIATKNILD
jgi:hypothetical protein